MRHSILPFLLLLAVPACGGEVISSGQPSSTTTGGVGGSGSSSGSGGFEATSGVGGATTCEETHDTLSVTLSTWDEHSFGCGAEMGDYELSAVVVENSSPGVFLLDSCPPNADCIAQPTTLTISANGLFTLIPQGTYVSVHLVTQPVWAGCSQRIQIKNLPTWGGQANPVQPGEALWFHGTDGEVGPFADMPLKATTEGLGCFPGATETECGGPRESYAWRFRPEGKPNDAGLFLPMGATKSWTADLAGGPQPLVARNLRSFVLSDCDASVALAYWVARDNAVD